MITYTANLSLALILLAIFSANSIGIRLSAPAHTRTVILEKFRGKKNTVMVYDHYNLLTEKTTEKWWHIESSILALEHLFQRSKDNFAVKYFILVCSLYNTSGLDFLIRSKYCTNRKDRSDFNLHFYMMAMHKMIRENIDFRYIWNAEQIWLLQCMLFECSYLLPHLLHR